MANIELNSFTLPELKQLHKDVSKAIESFENRRKAEALAALEAKAKELGFSLSDIAGATKGRKRSPSVPKYRHPENADITWTGRGRKPKWVQDHIDAGKDISSLEI